MVDQDGVEDGAGVVAGAEFAGLVRGEVRPADLAGVLHERVLHGPEFAAE